MKKAIVTGVLGQDGSHLADLLLEKGVEVHGVYRRVSTGANFDNIKDAYEDSSLHLHAGDICDAAFINELVADVKPDYYFGLAAMSHVGQSFKEPLKTFDVDANAVLIALDAVRRLSPGTKVYQASTSELFGGLKCPETGYTEESKFHPRSPYGVAKLAAYWAVANYREAYGLFACNGILHNHCGPRRGFDFATRKITRGVASIKLGLQDTLKMGNMSAERDIGHAKDYVKAMLLMLEVDKPEDYLVATGTAVSIRQMLEYVCELASLRYEDVYEMDERFMRPSEVPRLLGNPEKIRREIGWEPEYDWKMLLKEMYEHDLKELGKES